MGCDFATNGDGLPTVTFDVDPKELLLEKYAKREDIKEAPDLLFKVRQPESIEDGRLIKYLLFLKLLGYAAKMTDTVAHRGLPGFSAEELQESAAHNWDSDFPESLVEEIQFEEPPNVAANEPLMKIVKKCRDPEPSKRPSATHLYFMLKKLLISPFLSALKKQ